MPLFGFRFFGRNKKALENSLVQEKAKEILDASKEQGVHIDQVRLSKTVTRAAGISAVRHGFGAFFGGGGAGA